MMSQTDVCMSGGVWVWTTTGILAVVLLVVVIKLSKNEFSVRRCCEVNCQP